MVLLEGLFFARHNVIYIDHKQSNRVTDVWLIPIPLKPEERTAVVWRKQPQFLTAFRFPGRARHTEQEAGQSNGEEKVDG